MSDNELANENAMLRSYISRLRTELKWWVDGPKHDGNHEYTDKVDEGCFLCREAEQERWRTTLALLERTAPFGPLT